MKSGCGNVADILSVTLKKRGVQVMAVLYSCGKRYLESVRKWISKSDKMSFLETAD